MTPKVTAAVRAASETAGQCGIFSTDPVLLQETNNTVVWLRPQPVVAKVAVRPDSKLEIRREHAVAVELTELDAETAKPIRGTHPLTHSDTGFVVTLWEYLEGPDRSPVPAEELAGSLRRLHAAFDRTEVELPPFHEMVAKSRRALEDDSFMVDGSNEDRELLRASFDQGLLALERFEFSERRLHGEPHEGNRIATRDGLRWIDFESASIGPVEWDLAFQPDEVVELFPEVDASLLVVLRRLNSARVATWCLGSRHPEMKEHGRVHLELLRRSPDVGTGLPRIP